MCGRFSLHEHPNVIALQFGISETIDFAPKYNLAPTSAIIALHGAPRAMVRWRWGLVPYWDKQPDKARGLHNARADTIDVKPAFRDAWRQRRCIIPASGFYEWKSIAGRKQPYYIHSAGGELLAFAGIYQHSLGAAGEFTGCAVITTEPNELMREIHDRMPVILDSEDYGAWLDPKQNDLGKLKELLKPCVSECLLAHPVSTRVNNARYDDPSCVQPVASEELSF